MKLLNLKVTNFGSHPTFEMDLSAQGLALIYGPTGSGKSTIMDMAAWTLFGCTAKGGNADEVRSWLNLDEPTVGELSVLLNDTIVTVKRTRAKGAKNDLFFNDSPAGNSDGNSDCKRGKDLGDTQKLLEARLGVTKELFLAGAYFHEFSRTGTFFVAKSNERRELLEHVADTRLATKLQQSTSESRREAKHALNDAAATFARADERARCLAAQIERSRKASLLWSQKNEGEITFLQARIENFEKEKQSKIETVKTKGDRWEEEHRKHLDKIVAKIDRTVEIEPCAACGSGGNVADKAELLERLKEQVDQENPYFPNIQVYENMDNHYVSQLEAKLKETNPHTEELVYQEQHLAKAEAEVATMGSTLGALQSRISDLTYLYDISSELRGELVKRAVAEIEEATNGYLERYFESELKVTFNVSSDEVEVEIQKNGHDCVYRQLSKGQRGLLKLCFAVSVMKAASNKAGVHFDCLFLDEALDGLDADLKVRAFSLFEEIEKEHASVLVIDHSQELHQLFAKRFKVSMESDVSSIEEEHE